MILAFSLYIPIFPATGYDASIADPIETLRYLTLPSITLGTALAAITARMTRSEMLEEIGKEYVRTARAKGVTQLSVIFKHTLKNALVRGLRIQRGDRHFCQKASTRLPVRRKNYSLSG